MRDAPYELLNWAEVPPERIALLDRVRVRMNAPETGMVIVLDSEDVPHGFKWTWPWIDGPRALRLELDDASPDKTPPKLWEIAQKGEHAELVWVSNRVSRGHETGFVWNLAHELRHVEQRRRWPMLIPPNNFIRYSLPHLPLPDVSISIPIELDAELAAWRSARHFFGVEMADAYPQGEACGGPMADNYRALLVCDPDEPYDVCPETVVLLRTHRELLNELQPTFPEPEARTFDLDATVRTLVEMANQHLLLGDDTRDSLNKHSS